MSILKQKIFYWLGQGLAAYWALTRWQKWVVVPCWTLLFWLMVTLIQLLWNFAWMSELKTGYVRVIVNPITGSAYHSWSAQKPKEWVDYRAISPYLVKAAIVSEDGNFYNHEGYDPAEIRSAIHDTVKKGKKLRGASTITQQLAKNLYLSHSRSFFRKGKEILLAIGLDYFLTKRRIMELYLNVIEYGDCLYGVGPAAQFYFKKRPSQLRPKEAAFLIMLLPSPVRYQASFHRQKLSPYARKTIRKILNKMARQGIISGAQARSELGAPFRWERR